MLTPPRPHSSLLDSFSALRATAFPRPASPKGGRPPRLSPSDLVAGLAWHVLQPGGTLSANLAMLQGVRMADSSLSERRQSLGTKPWTDALEAFLRKDMGQSGGPNATYKGFRLVGVDGTTFSCGNTRTLKEALKKIKSRRGKEAFFRISCVALCELGTHRPLAVQIGQNEESEGNMAAQIVKNLAASDLLIADRYYGSGKWVVRLSSLASPPMFLLRIQKGYSAIVRKKLADGSKLVHVVDPNTGKPLLVREIKAKVRRKGRLWTAVRFWTNLLDQAQYPSGELISLYAMRWEQEIAFRELKQHLHGEPILASHTLPTAVQEICALFMAQGIVSAARSKVSKEQQIPILEVSFVKTLASCRRLCWLWALAGREIGDALWEAVARRVDQELAWQASKPRRARSCPREVRQPIGTWPRLLKNRYAKGPFEFKIRKSGVSERHWG